VLGKWNLWWNLEYGKEKEGPIATAERDIEEKRRTGIRAPHIFHFVLAFLFLAALILPAVIEFKHSINCHLL
jgi:hypothetical protein